MCVCFRGVWNVPFATNAMLIQGHKLPAVRDGYSKFTDMDPDMSMANTLREKVGSHVLLLVFTSQDLGT